MGSDEKKCNVCDEVKAADDFPAGRGWRCKPCKVLTDKVYRKCVSMGYHGAYIDAVESGHLKDLVQEFCQQGGQHFDCELYFGSDASDRARRAEEIALQPRRAEAIALQPLSGSPQPMPDPQPSSGSFPMPRIDIRVNLDVRYRPW